MDLEGELMNPLSEGRSPHRDGAGTSAEPV